MPLSFSDDNAIQVGGGGLVSLSILAKKIKNTSILHPFGPSVLSVPISLHASFLTEPLSFLSSNPKALYIDS
jgi:hypothetical protein